MIRDQESSALSNLFIISKISNLQRLELLGVILTSGIRYRLCSSELVPVPSATRTYKARSARSYLTYDCHYPLIKRFLCAYWLMPLQTLTDYEH